MLSINSKLEYYEIVIPAYTRMAIYAVIKTYDRDEILLGLKRCFYPK